MGANRIITRLQDLDDVLAAGLAGGRIPRYNAGTGLFEFAALTGADVGLPNVLNVTQPRVLFSATSGSSVLAAETDLASYPMPADTLAAGKILDITAGGVCAANANGKTVKLYFGSVEIGRAVNGTASNGGGWNVTACRIICITSTTQNARTRTSQTASNAIGVNENANNLFNSQPNQTLSNIINIRITGTGVASGDVQLREFIVTLLN